MPVKVLRRCSGYKKIIEINEIRSRTELQQAELHLVREREKEVEQKKKLLQKQGTELAHRLKMLAKIANVYSGPAGQQIAYIREIMSALNLNLGIIGGFKKK